MRGQTLVIFTLEFPYGKAETFLETEITFLSKHFSEIYIIPSSNVSNVARRITPNSVIICDRIADTKKPFSFILFGNYLLEFTKVFLYSFWYSTRKKNYLRYVKSLMHHYYNDASKQRSILHVIDEYKLHEALFYDYWFCNSSLSLISLKKAGIIKKIICRAHGFDLYDERAHENLIPFREYKINYVDHVYTISQHGQKYLLENSLKRYASKIKISYLGVLPPTKIPPKGEEKIVISCSSIVPVKQVDKIARALSRIKVPFKWIHFGDGPEFNQVSKIVGDFPEHIKVELKKFVVNKKLQEFYKSRYVSCFISLSSSEGLPVSMMEAQSFGIPIVAPHVNGIPEIVNENTGVLVNKNYSESDIAKIVESILKEELIFSRAHIIQFFNSNFNAMSNYNNFALKLVQHHG